ncbi:DUF402 domain-containing protein [Brevibacterium antiquum]|uniref:DUF402 domain-containing protein n=1 Tax=Brevibacterium antiquum TaxID=234835 RepID=UPI0018DFD044|nr:DUF402 domain-containing protein [Brevibacterium antiquum]
MSSAGETRWQPGSQILWTYVNPDFPGLLDQRPVTVVADDDRHLAVWLAPGSRMLHQVIADGSPIRSLEGSDRFMAPRAQAIRDWAGAGILAVFQPEIMYSVWLFETESGLRDSYYINIEVPYVRTDVGIETSDLVLDVVASADGSYRYKDEDELAFAHEAGLFSGSDVAEIRQAAANAVDDVTAWRFPFDAGYQTFQPHPDWPIPSLPHDASWTFES